MTKLLLIQALSPLHAGTGQSIGAVDLAIARDRATGFPYLPGSSLKGSLRARAEDAKEPKRIAVFGPETNDAAKHSGSLVVGDANLLLLPVRSVAGTFAYATSPYLLQRFARDCIEAGLTPPRLPPAEAIDSCHVATKSLLVGDKVVLEDFDLKATVASADIAALAGQLGSWLFPENGPMSDAWRRGVIERLCVVHDDVMAFLSEYATDVVARVALQNETKTVNGGQLWTEESLPTETILVSLLGAMANGQIAPAEVFAVVETLGQNPLQLGGKATVGRGRCRLVMPKGGGK